MIPRNRPARAAAAVGATLAAGAVTMLAVTTTASADEPGRCTQNVNVRKEPDAQSRIVALCEEGTRVKLGEKRDGFVRIDELGGWAAADYVKADAPSSSSSGSSSDGERGGSDGERDDAGRSSSGSSDGDASDDVESATDGADRSGDDASRGEAGDEAGDEAAGADAPREARVSADRARFGGLLG